QQAQTTPEPTPTPTAREENSALPELLLVAVTPAPKEESPPPAPAEEAAEIVTADLSAAGKIHNSTSTPVDTAALAAEGLQLQLRDGVPQVLIFHTHSSEAYTPDGRDQYEESDPFRTEDKTCNVIRVGDRLTEKLEEYGLNVIHDREIYDYPSYTGSYSRSGAAVEQYLKDYPDIKIVIDLHRDALGSEDVIYKTQAELSGKSSAQVMLLAGTGENGLWHPNWRENLKLALYMQNAMDARYPSLARPIELVCERYNQQLSEGMLILEAGSTGNTLQEALTAIELFADAVGPALAELIV
ncbi:MAG: stage II sporulation protein P, partial [Ruminococcaceae bacterium]|nr:stage II sporulation protein P [Oscillospiraceae bacterium]